jgi:tetratricopeptide (TPR) repeat protein
VSKQTSDQDPTFLSQSYRCYRAAFEHLLSDSAIQDCASIGVESKDIKRFQEIYRASGYLCSFPGCRRGFLGFPSAPDRNNHEAFHSPQFRCVELDCDFSKIGFNSRQAFRKHRLKYHTSVNEVPLPRFGHRRPIAKRDDHRETAKADNECDDLCDQVQRDVVTMASQLVRPTSLMATYGVEDISSFQILQATSPLDSAWQPSHLCSKCRGPSSAHFISLDRLTPSEMTARNLLDDSQSSSLTLPSTTRDYGGATRWVALCFSACIYLTRGEAELSMRSLAEAATVFEDMLIRRDDLILTDLHLMVTILHMYDQSDIAKSITHSASAVAERLLYPTDSIRLTLQWEVAAADLRLEESGFGSGMLLQVYTDFEMERTLSHPWTIAALYNLAWMLLYEGSLAGEGVDPQPIYTEAADMLQKVYVASCASLGSAHMQSITALTTLARAQSNLGKDDKAIESYKNAIHDCRYTLGRSHPYRLEAMRRLALMYEKKGQKEKMEPLYWDVLRGRITMLGRHHPWTEGMKEDLIALLKDLEKWEDNGPLQWQIDELFEHASETSSQHRPLRYRPVFRLCASNL